MRLNKDNVKGLICALSLFTSLCLLSNCASIHPSHFYSLTPSLDNASDKKQRLVTGNLSPVFVSVPANLQRPQIVINQANGQDLMVLEHSRWLSAFDEQLSDALTSGIHAKLLTQSALSNQHYRITVDLLTMQTLINDAVSADFNWEISQSNQTENASEPNILSCTFSASKPIGNSVESAVKGMQAITQDLINQLSEQMVKMASAPVTNCH